VARLLELIDNSLKLCQQRRKILLGLFDQILVNSLDVLLAILDESLMQLSVVNVNEFLDLVFILILDFSKLFLNMVD